MTQTDWLRDSPAAQAAALRVMAQTARIDPHWTPEQGESRARYYETEAERLERDAA
jgi:hypothetical protein